MFFRRLFCLTGLNQLTSEILALPFSAALAFELPVSSMNVGRTTVSIKVNSQPPVKWNLGRDMEKGETEEMLYLRQQ